MASSLNTFVYKKIEDTSILADVYTPLKSVSQKAPVLLYIHGGYYIRGDRKLIPTAIVIEAIQRSWIVVSVDYRLAPETKQPEILQDIIDAYKWVHGELQDACGLEIDTSKIIVMGGSAGGNAALLSSHYCSPKPAGLVGICPYNDCRKIVSENSYRSEDFGEILQIMEEIHATKGSPLPTSEPLRVELKDNNVTPIDVNVDSLRNRRNSKFREQGILIALIVGFDPKSTENASRLAKLTPSKVIDSNYPPVYLMHGGNDQLVPSEHSKEIANACKKLGVKVRLDIVPEMGHCFDLSVEHGDKVFKEHILPIFDFMDAQFQ